MNVLIQRKWERSGIGKWFREHHCISSTKGLPTQTYHTWKRHAHSLYFSFPQQLTPPTIVTKFKFSPPSCSPKPAPSHSDRGYYIGMLDSVERERCELKKRCLILMQKRIEHQLEQLRETSERFERKLHVRQEKAKVQATCSGNFENIIF